MDWTASTRREPRRPASAALCAAALLLAGCGRTPDTVPEAPTLDAPPAQFQPPPARQPPAAPEPAWPWDTPDGAIRALLRGLEEHRPEVFWDFLPRGYRDDINDLIRDFAGRVDAAQWRRSFNLAARLLAVSEQKQPLLLQSRWLRLGEEGRPGEYSADFQAARRLVETLVRSDLADPQRLEQLDVRKFLADSGGAFLQDLARISRHTPADVFNMHMAGYAAAEVAVVRQEDGAATVRITLAGSNGAGSDTGSDSGQMVELVRVQGQWIPRQLAEGWATAIQQVREELRKFASKSSAAQPQQSGVGLQELERLVELLERAETVAQIDAALAPWVETLGARSVGGVLQPPPTSAAAASSVRVVIRRELSAAEDEAVSEALLQLADRPDFAVVTSQIDGGVSVYAVSPVADAESFAERITFARVVELDVAQRRITLQWPE